LTRETLFAYMAHQYGPGNAVVSIAGDVDHEELADTVQNALSEWKNEREITGCPGFVEGEFQKVAVEQRDTEQVNISLALPALSVFHPERFALSLLNIILGEGMSSRLFSEIRDRLGLAYSVHSYVDQFRDAGSLTVGAGVDTDKVGTAVSAIIEQLAGLKNGLPEEEITRAKELFKGRLMLRMEDSRSVSSWFASQELLLGNIQTVDEVIEIIEAITPEDLMRVTGELFHSSGLNLAVVGPNLDKDRLERILKL